MKLTKIFDTWMNLDHIAGVTFLDMRNPKDRSEPVQSGNNSISTQIWFAGGGCISIQGKLPDEVAAELNAQQGL